MNSTLHYLIPAITGSLIAILGPINSSLQAKSGFWGMAIVVHIIGLAVAGIGYLTIKSNNPIYIISDFKLESKFIIAITGIAIILSFISIKNGMQSGLPFFAFLGGLIGLLIIMGTVYSIDKVGVLMAITIIMVFEIIIGGLIDNFGLLGRDKIPFNMFRILSISLILIGILINLKNK